MPVGLLHAPNGNSGTSRAAAFDPKSVFHARLQDTRNLPFVPVPVGDVNGILQRDGNCLGRQKPDDLLDRIDVQYRLVSFARKFDDICGAANALSLLPVPNCE